AWWLLRYEYAELSNSVVQITTWSKSRPATLNQKSIKSFFETLKRSRPEELVLDNTETRQSKSARISSPISNDFGSDNLESDINDIYEISVHQNDFTSLSITI